MGSGPTKLPCGGGVGVSHSSVLASQGFPAPDFPANMLQTKLKRNTNWLKPRQMALMVMNTLMGCTPSRKAYCVGL
ncbi:hypothetical protein D3C83_218920 [compost metagenome]